MSRFDGGRIEKQAFLHALGRHAPLCRVDVELAPLRARRSSHGRTKTRGAGCSARLATTDLDRCEMTPTLRRAYTAEVLRNIPPATALRDGVPENAAAVLLRTMRAFNRAERWLSVLELQKLESATPPL